MGGSVAIPLQHLSSATGNNVAPEPHPTLDTIAQAVLGTRGDKHEAWAWTEALANNETVQRIVSTQDTVLYRPGGSRATVILPDHL